MAFIKTHQPCLDPDCGSSDGLSYDDKGWARCFSCNQNFNVSAEGNYTETKQVIRKRMSNIKESYEDMLNSKTYPAFSERGLSSDTCKHYNIFSQSGVTLIGYRDGQNELNAVKVRSPDKDFNIQGNWKDVKGLYGQNLFTKGGKFVTITEGELDAASAFQMMGSRYPVLSVKNGAGSAYKDCKESFDFLDSYENVVICFDNDEVGQKAAKEVANLFGTKAKIVKLTRYKDANEYLVNNKGREFNQAWWDAEYQRQGKVVDIHDFIDKAMTKPKMGLSFPWPTVTKACFGIRPHTIHIVGAAPKIGKTDHEHQLIHHLVFKENETVGVFDLENHPINTAKKIASKQAKKNFLRPDIEYEDTELRSSLESLEGKVRFYDREGSRDWKELKTALIEMHLIDGINIFIIDPITALISRYSASEANDRLNEICTDAADLVNKYPMTLFFYSHVNPKQKGSKPHDAGGKVYSSEFTGSRAMEKWFHYGHGISRDRTEDCPDHLRNVSETYMLFDRDFGQQYKAYLYFDEVTVSYLETELVEEL